MYKRQADYVLELSSDREFSTLWALRAILSGKPLDPARASHLTGHSLDELGKIVATLKDANYVAIFSDLDFRGTRRMASEFEAMARLVRELSQETRCVSLPLGGPGNRAGAEGVATWQTGFPLGVDLASGGPSSIPGISSAIDRLSRREADLAVIVADAIPDDLPPRAIERLEAIPKIVIAPATVPYNFTPTVRFATENPFLSSRGTVIRCDGVPLPLRAPIATESPSDAECLRAISSKLDEPGFSTRTRR